MVCERNWFHQWSTMMSKPSKELCKYILTWYCIKMHTQCLDQIFPNFIYLSMLNLVLFELKRVPGFPYDNILLTYCVYNSEYFNIYITSIVNTSEFCVKILLLNALKKVLLKKGLVFWLKPPFTCLGLALAAAALTSSALNASLKSAIMQRDPKPGCKTWHYTSPDVLLHAVSIRAQTDGELLLSGIFLNNLGISIALGCCRFWICVCPVCQTYHLHQGS